LKNLITIGKIIKPSGLKGRVKVLSYLTSPRILEEQSRVLIGTDENDPVAYVIKEVSIKGKFCLLSLRGIDGVEESECLKGKFMYLPREVFDAPGEDEYFWDDIIGLEVVTEEGEKLGVVTSIIPTGSNDVYVCEGPGGEVLLPAVEDFIKKIDVNKGIMIAERPEEI